MAAILEQYRISDFLEWSSERRLLLNPDFQRSSVWTPPARIYLIDTILRQLPMPKIYLRTKVDIVTKKSIREVVDGQQRLRTIIDFANDRFVLSKRAAEFEGLRYSTMPPELQETFLSYPISVGQFLNATDADVLEVFSRLNSYSVQLNPAEKRHAMFQGEFKWAVRNRSRHWSVLWEKYGIVTVRQRVRMQDDSLTAEMFGVILEGVRDGGAGKIEALYRKYDKAFDPEGEIPKKLDAVLQFFVTEFADSLVGTPVLNSPHFLMLFAALAHAIYGIPAGDIDEDEMPPREKQALSNKNAARDNLLQLASIMDAQDPPGGFEAFWGAAKASTQRIASRRTRFLLFYQALLPTSL